MQIPVARNLQPPSREDFLPRAVLRIVPQAVPRMQDRAYDLSTGLHTYGVTYPVALRRPELIDTRDQITFRRYETISCSS